MNDRAYFIKFVSGSVLFAAALCVSGCGQSLVPPIPEIAPFPSKVLTAEQQSKAIAEMTAKKDREFDDAERRIKDAR